MIRAQKLLYYNGARLAEKSPVFAAKFVGAVVAADIGDEDSNTFAARNGLAAFTLGDADANAVTALLRHFDGHIGVGDLLTPADVHAVLDVADYMGALAGIGERVRQCSCKHAHNVAHACSNSIDNGILVLFAAKYRDRAELAHLWGNDFDMLLCRYVNEVTAKFSKNYNKTTYFSAMPTDVRMFLMGCAYGRGYIGKHSFFHSADPLKTPEWTKLFQ